MRPQAAGLNRHDVLRYSVRLATFVRVLFVVLLIAGTASAFAATGLVQTITCADPADNALHSTASGQGRPNCQRGWAAASPDAYVLSGTSATTAVWGNPDFRWRRLRDLRPTDLVEVCRADIPPGPFAPPARPVVQPTCEDPCGCNNDHKGPVPVSTLQSTPGDGTVTLPEGRRHLVWEAPTANTDGTPLTDLAGYVVHIRVPAAVLELFVEMPPGAFVLGVRAVNTQGIESDRVEVPVRIIDAPLPGDPPPASGKVAGIAAGQRAVYRVSSTGTRGTKVGDLPVGTTAAPLGIGCDPLQFVRSGSTVYGRVTDPRAGDLNGFYVTGCRYEAP